MRCLSACLAAATLAVTIPSYADTTFTYRGADYSTAFAPFTTGEAADGAFTVAGTLAPGLDGSALIPLSGFSFSDGVEQYNLSSSDTVNFFAPFTDASGNLTSFFLELVTTLPGSTPSDLNTNNLILSYGSAFAGQIQTIAFQDRNGELAASGQTLADGTLTSKAISATPEPSSIALLFTGTLCLVGLRRRTQSQR